MTQQGDRDRPVAIPAESGALQLVELPPLVLPDLSVRRWLPSPELRPWVDLYWLAEGQAPSVIQAHGYADGGTTLLFEGLDSTQPEGYWEARPYHGVRRFAVSHRAMGVRLCPGGAWQLAGGRRRGRYLAEVLDGEPSWLTPLAEELAELLTLGQRLVHLDAFLCRLAHDAGLAIDTVQRVLPILTQSEVPVAAWQSRIGITRRGLERIFERQVGMSPGQLALAWRIKAARQALTDSTAAIAEIAVDTGFHDQAHLTHAFRRIVGEPPGAYRRRKWSQIYNRR
ncbi:AraC family transcriptional regulator [Halomonas huangheensis]|uniref:HTH araC/xylS-type domain-containing protein n=1 Tax=Halomonas huangheensis TaxID=1178482 RepID=W1N3D1_9GAMM|nr:helix-turn-helix domain-containing protein [Halomonas huangheensis]ALM52243.1 hypothetical protein AR456_08050 [Halomonas huangheensis]ERL49465.1 hypothetical protein BJB45_06710 [Halomonas huangheensis]